MMGLRVLLVCCLGVLPSLAQDGTASSSAVSAPATSAALDWVVSQQRDDHGWGSETAKAVIAMSLVNSSALGPTDWELTLKQLQIDFLVDMWRHKDYPLTSGRLAEYVLAFVSLCYDVGGFHGKDLTAVLQHHRGVMDYEYAFVVLATCAAGSNVRRRSYSKLLSVTDDSDELHGTDTLALSVMALRCVADRNARNVERHLAGPLQALVGRQQDDGSFGNFHSTLLAVEALRLEGVKDGWNETAAVAYLTSHQQADGSFGSLFDTTQVLPVLASKSLLDVTRTPCHTNEHDKGKATTTTTTSAPTTTAASATGGDGGGTAAQTVAPPATVSFTLWLWIGSDVNQSYSIELTVPKNTSLFDCLKLAAERDSNFEFGVTVWPNGHYVHTIGGYHEQKVGYHFWLLYKLPSAPDPNNKPSNKFVAATGVDELRPENGDHVLFWYKKI